MLQVDFQRKKEGKTKKSSTSEKRKKNSFFLFFFICIYLLAFSKAICTKLLTINNHRDRNDFAHSHQPFSSEHTVHTHSNTHIDAQVMLYWLDWIYLFLKRRKGSDIYGKYANEAKNKVKNLNLNAHSLYITLYSALTTHSKHTSARKHRIQSRWKLNVWIVSACVCACALSVKNHIILEHKNWKHYSIYILLWIYP